MLVAAATAACGSGDGRLSKREYLDRLRAIESGTAARDAGRLYFKLVVDPALAPRQCAARLNEFEGHLDEIVDGVDELRPPADVQTLQNEFVTAARESIAVVRAAADDVADARLSCGRPMNERIYGLASTKRAERVLEELGRRGYILGLNAED